MDVMELPFAKEHSEGPVKNVVTLRATLHMSTRPSYG